jgi:hypothetical protein
MSEYIEREAAEKIIASITPSMSSPDGCSENDHLVFAAQEMCADVIQVIHNLPNADVAPVRHGRWERYHEADVGWDEWGVRCSNCGLEVEDKDFTFPEKFCPNCGAWMN